MDATTANRRLSVINCRIDPPTAGAEGKPDLDFALPGEASSEQHVPRLAQAENNTSRTSRMQVLITSIAAGRAVRRSIGRLNFQPFLRLHILRLLASQPAVSERNCA